MKEYKEIVCKIEPVYKEIFHSELINWSLLMNSALIENTTLHVHWHLRPRHSKPVIIDVEEFIDKQFGYYYDENARRMPNESNMVAIVSEIAKDLDGKLYLW